MSNLPQNPNDPTLNYQTPLRQPSPNTAGKIILRICAGIAGGIVSCALGAVFVAMSNQSLLFFVPPGIVLIALIVLFFKYKRVGYVTGFLLAPFVVIVGVCTFLLIICSMK